MHVEERVNVYIDGSNLYHGLKNNCRQTQIDFAGFIALLVGDRRLTRAYYYNAPVRREDGEDRYRSQQRFFGKLYHVDYLEVRLGRLMRRGNTFVEKGVDVRLAVDLIEHANLDLYDVAVLVSGDGDFAYAVEAVKNHGKHVENAYFSGGRSQHLLQVADRFVELSEEFLKSCFLSESPT